MCSPGIGQIIATSPSLTESWQRAGRSDSFATQLAGFALYLLDGGGPSSQGGSQGLAGQASQAVVDHNQKIEDAVNGR